jgi:hypothetical protein
MLTSNAAEKMKNTPLAEAWKILRKCRNGSTVFTVEHSKVIAAVETIGREKSINYLSVPRRPRAKRALRRGRTRDMMAGGKRLPGSFQSRL